MQIFILRVIFHLRRQSIFVSCVFVATRLQERENGVLSFSAWCVQLLKLTLWPTEAEYEDKTFSPRSEMLSAAKRERENDSLGR